MKTLLILALTALVGACSNPNAFIYNSAQENAKNNCEQHVDSQSKDCEKDFNLSYEEYQRERQALLKGQEENEK